MRNITTKTTTSILDLAVPTLHRYRLCFDDVEHTHTHSSSSSSSNYEPQGIDRASQKLRRKWFINIFGAKWPTHNSMHTGSFHCPRTKHVLFRQLQHRSTIWFNLRSLWAPCPMTTKHENEHYFAGELIGNSRGTHCNSNAKDMQMQVLNSVKFLRVL